MSGGFLCTHLCDERWCSATVSSEVADRGVCVASCGRMFDDTGRGAIGRNVRVVLKDLLRPARYSGFRSMISDHGALCSPTLTALELVLSTRTVEGHVESILAKLRMTSRTQIASWMNRRSVPDR